MICEVVNDDGTMARVPDLIKFCRQHNLVMVTVDELARYRLEREYEESLGTILNLLPATLKNSAVELGQSSRAVLATGRS